jgi:hypothetical protein
MGGRIFISYRRGDDTASAGRLYDRLNRPFRRRLFMDVDSIPPGEDFVAVLEREVAACDVLLALIGRGWLTAVDESGRRRLDNPADFVRVEISAGLAQGKRVIPVLIDTVAMPRTDELPEDLRPLTRRNAVRIGHERFEADTQRLIKALRPIVGTAKPPSPGAIAPPSPASGRRSGTPAATVRTEHQKPLPPGEVGAHAPGEGAAAPKPADQTPTAPHIHIGVDPRTLPDLAIFKDIDAPWCPEMVIIPAGSLLMGSPPSSPSP